MAVAVVGLVGSAVVNVGADGTGMVNDKGAEGGVGDRSSVMAVTATSYETPAFSPLTGQSVGDAHVTTTAGPPPTGVAVNVYEVKGPPMPGGVALSKALVGLVGVTASMSGALREVREQAIIMLEPYLKSFKRNVSIIASLDGWG